MGLDIVELMMRVEEEFRIEIEDEEASYISTVGQLHTLILDKTGVLKPSRCVSSTTFYQLRRALVDLAIAPRQSIAPATPIAALLPASKRRQGWKEWSEKAQLNLPALEKPRWVCNVGWLAVAASLALSLICWIHAPSFVFFYCVTIFAFCYWICQWSQRHAIQLPANCASVGAITKAAMKLNYGINAEWEKSDGADEIWDRLKAIVVDEISADPDEVTREADFIRDLRMD